MEIGVSLGLNSSLKDRWSLPESVLQGFGREKGFETLSGEGDSRSEAEELKRKAQDLPLPKEKHNSLEDLVRASLEGGNPLERAIVSHLQSKAIEPKNAFYPTPAVIVVKESYSYPLRGMYIRVPAYVATDYENGYRQYGPNQSYAQTRNDIPARVLLPVYPLELVLQRQVPSELGISKEDRALQRDIPSTIYNSLRPIETRSTDASISNPAYFVTDRYETQNVASLSADHKPNLLLQNSALLYSAQLPQFFLAYHQMPTPFQREDSSIPSSPEILLTSGVHEEMRLGQPVMKVSRPYHSGLEITQIPGIASEYHQMPEVFQKEAIQLLSFPKILPGAKVRQEVQFRQPATMPETRIIDPLIPVETEQNTNLQEIPLREIAAQTIPVSFNYKTESESYTRIPVNQLQNLQTISREIQHDPHLFDYGQKTQIRMEVRPTGFLESKQESPTHKEQSIGLRETDGKMKDLRHWSPQLTEERLEYNDDRSLLRYLPRFRSEIIISQGPLIAQGYGEVVCPSRETLAFDPFIHSQIRPEHHSHESKPAEETLEERLVAREDTQRAKEVIQEYSPRADFSAPARNKLDAVVQSLHEIGYTDVVIAVKNKATGEFYGKGTDKIVSSPSINKLMLVWMVEYFIEKGLFNPNSETNIDDDLVLQREKESYKMFANPGKISYRQLKPLTTEESSNSAANHVLKMIAEQLSDYFGKGNTVEDAMLIFNQFYKEMGTGPIEINSRYQRGEDYHRNRSSMEALVNFMLIKSEGKMLSEERTSALDSNLDHERWLAHFRNRGLLRGLKVKGKPTVTEKGMGLVVEIGDYVAAAMINDPQTPVYVSPSDKKDSHNRMEPAGKKAVNRLGSLFDVIEEEYFKSKEVIKNYRKIEHLVVKAEDKGKSIIDVVAKGLSELGYKVEIESVERYFNTRTREYGSGRFLKLNVPGLAIEVEEEGFLPQIPRNYLDESSLEKKASASSRLRVSIKPYDTTLHPMRYRDAKQTKENHEDVKTVEIGSSEYQGKKVMEAVYAQALQNGVSRGEVDSALRGGRLFVSRQKKKGHNGGDLVDAAKEYVSHEHETYRAVIVPKAGK